MNLSSELMELLTPPSYPHSTSLADLSLAWNSSKNSSGCRVCGTDGLDPEYFLFFQAAQAFEAAVRRYCCGMTQERHAGRNFLK
jgi:hypothetical protein